MQKNKKDNIFLILYLQYETIELQRWHVSKNANTKIYYQLIVCPFFLTI